MSGVNERHAVLVEAKSWLIGQRQLPVLLSTHGGLAVPAVRLLIDGVIVATQDAYAFVPYPSEDGKAVALTGQVEGFRWLQPFAEVVEPQLTAKWFAPNAFLKLDPESPYELIGTKKAMRGLVRLIRDSRA